MVKIEDIKRSITTLNLAGKNLSIHTSYKSFGGVEGGPKGLVNAFLDMECTLLTPTFSYSYMTEPDEDSRPTRNAWDYNIEDEEGCNADKIFTTDSKEVDDDMGIISKTILSMEASYRGYNSLDSFSAIGENARYLTESQTQVDVYAPFKRLIESNGYVILMGVELNKMSLIHHCEKEAGRKMFIRWALGGNNKKDIVETGGCSEGFVNFYSDIKSISRELKIGKSHWIIIPAAKAFDIIKRKILKDPWSTRCDNDQCVFCLDGISGGPLYNSSVT